MEIKNAVLKIPVLMAAEAASVEALLPFASILALKKGEHLFSERDALCRVFFLVSGTASLYKLSGSHDKKVIFTFSEGAMLNDEVLDGKPASSYCETLSDSCVLCVERRAFLRVMENDFKLAQAVMDSMALKIRRLYRQMRNTSGAVKIDKKIAAKLWKLSKDYGVPCGLGTKIEYDLSVTFLAEMLGSKRETVSRQLKLLTESGVVIISKNRFIVTDCDKLLEYFNNA